MSDGPSAKSYIELTANIVSAYVSHNATTAGELPGLIGQVLADDDVEGRCCPIRLARGDTAGDQRRNLAQRLSTDGSGGKGGVPQGISHCISIAAEDRPHRCDLYVLAALVLLRDPPPRRVGRILWFGGLLCGAWPVATWN